MQKDSNSVHSIIKTEYRSHDSLALIAGSQLLELSLEAVTK